MQAYLTGSAMADMGAPLSVVLAEADGGELRGCAGVGAARSALPQAGHFDRDCGDGGVSLLQLRAGMLQSEPPLERPGGRGPTVALLQGGRRRRASKQGSAAAGGGGPSPTSAELKTLAAVVGRLWQIDAPYRLQPGAGYRLDHQAKAAPVNSNRDASPKKLFTYVNEAEVSKTPCAASFIALLDNYNRDASQAELASTKKQQEEHVFTQCVMRTPHMRYVYNVLVAWRTIKPDFAAFSKQVADMWFTEFSMKSRGPRVSSGFEHVFVGEEKMDRKKRQPVISGMHNWIQFWREERARRMDYLGYVGRLDKDDDRLVSVRFAWDDDDPEQEKKSVSTFLVGTSAAFELAMLTCAFLGFGGEAKVPGIYFGDVGPVQLTAYAWKTPRGQVVRTAYLDG